MTLHLLNPWPELLEAGASFRNLDELDITSTGAFPIFCYCFIAWRNSKRCIRDRSGSTTRRSCEMVRAGARTNNPKGGEELRRGCRSGAQDTEPVQSSHQHPRKFLRWAGLRI